MDKSMNLNYQYTLFGEFSDIKPDDSDTIIKLISLFKEENFIPASFQEFNMNIMPPKIDNRISLTNKDGITINIGNTRLDLIFAYNEQGKYKEMEINSITIKAIKMLQLLLRNFNKNCNRIALNTMHLLSSDESNKVIKKYRENNQIIEYYNMNEPYEWNERLVTKKRSKEMDEDINVITELNRTKGSIANNNNVIPFDGIILQFDINTLAEKLNYRFGEVEIEKFFNNVIKEKSYIEENFI